MLFELIGSILSLIITLVLITFVLPKIEIYISKKRGKKYYDNLVNESVIDLTKYSTDKLYCILCYLGNTPKDAYVSFILNEFFLTGRF